MKIMKTQTILLSVILTSMLGLDANSQTSPCSAPDITISTDVTWQDQTIFLEPNRKIIITDGATLTIERCTLRRAYDCPGYWDGIYLVTTQNGKKAGLLVEESVIEFSQFGIQASNGWEHIELVETVMRDNGQMINVRDNWPFPPFTTSGGGGLNGEDPDILTRSNFILPEVWGLDGQEGGGAEPCDYNPAPKVIISNQCQMLVKNSGNPAVDPQKQIRQVSVLGGELVVSNSNFVNGQSTWRVAAISASRGKCQIYGTRFQDFWTTIYKGSDAQANCTSEGLILTGSYIIDPQYWNIPGVFGQNEFAIYNVSSNMLVVGNIIEGIIRSEGIAYGGLFNNAIFKSPNTTSTVWIDSPEESMRIRDNKFYNTPTEYYGHNKKTDVTCNNWEFIDYGYSPVAVAAGGKNQFPVSWGTISKAAGNIWETTMAEMWDLSSNSGTLRYYYRETQANEIFNWFSIIPQSVENADEGCTYTYPEALVDLDTTEYTLSGIALQSAYTSIDSLLGVIKSSEDTTQTAVQEVIADLERQLSHLVGKGALFMDATNRHFWTEKLHPRVLELSELNALWYAHELDTIQSRLRFHADPDAQVLNDIADLVLTYLDSSDLYSLSPMQVKSVDSIARTSYSDYTNIVRNFLYMVYDSLIVWDQESVLDSIRAAESFSEPPAVDQLTPQPVFMVYPNPFTESLEITKIDTDAEPEIAGHWIEVMTLDGKVVSSAALFGKTGNVALTNLDPGLYFVRITSRETGKTVVHKIYKSTK